MTRCPNCKSLLIVCGTGAVCSRDLSCGRVHTAVDRAAINAEWTRVRNEAFVFRLPRVTPCSMGSERRYTIEGKTGTYRLIKTIPETEELTKVAKQPPVEEAILAACEIKGRLVADWYVFSE